MPSGAKKRKIAKKKKEKAFNFQSITKSQGINGIGMQMKTHNVKESDSGELDSLEYQEHHHPLTEEQKEEGEKGNTDSSSFEPVFVDAANKPMEYSEKIEAEVKEVVQVGREYRIDNDFHSRNVSIDYVYAVEKLSDKGLSQNASSSSNSSSDAESPAIENNSPAIVSEKLKESSNLDKKLVIPIEKLVVFHEEVTQVVEDSTAKDLGYSNMIVLISKAKEDITFPPVDKNSGASDVINLGFPSSDKNEGDLGLTNLVLPGDENVVAPAVIHSNFPSSDENAESLDSGSKKNEDKLLLSLDGLPIVGTGNGEHSKVTNAHESPENQPLLASSPLMVHRASWKGCCGLFDVLMSSDR